jgi:hypothetical protein
MAEPRRYVPVVGIGASVLVLIVLVVPFAFADPAEVTLYYDAGDLNPLVAGLFALLSIVVLAAGRTGRTDPATAAGVALALGAFGTAAATVWALTVRVDVLTVSALSDHPIALAVVTLGMPLSALWYARSLRLL